MVSSYQFGACIWIIRESTVKNRGLQAIFDSSQDGLVSLEAPWYLPSFSDILDGEDIVATKGVGPLKGCGVVFSDLFFWGVDRQKVGTPLKKTLKCKHGSWIHGSMGRPSIRKSCSWSHGSMLNFMGCNKFHEKFVNFDQSEDLVGHIWASGVTACTATPTAQDAWGDGRIFGRWEGSRLWQESEIARYFVTSSCDGYDEFLFFLFQAI